MTFLNHIDNITAMFERKQGPPALLHLLIDNNIVDRKYIEKLLEVQKLRHSDYRKTIKL